MSIQDLRDVKIITAMITPFKEDGSINFDVLPELIEHLLAHHTQGILLAGTTAESPTLTRRRIGVVWRSSKNCQWPCSSNCWYWYQRYP